MRVYIATKWEAREEAIHLAAIVSQLGCVVMCRWWLETQNTATQAVLDLEGVILADVLIILAKRDFPYKGVYAELGAALATDTPVWIVGNSLDSCIFTKHPLVVKFNSVDEMLIDLKDTASAY